MTLPYAEFVYVGPPDPLEWRQPQLGMDTHGRRAAMNNPHGFTWNLRVVGDPYLDGSRILFVRIANERLWWLAHHKGVTDPRAWVQYSPAEHVWMIYGVNEP